MEQVLSEILNKVETIGKLVVKIEDTHDIDAGEEIQDVIDNLWALILEEKRQLYLESLWEIP